jgi:acetyl esterase/lipase
MFDTAFTGSTPPGRAPGRHGSASPGSAGRHLRRLLAVAGLAIAGLTSGTGAMAQAGVLTGLTYCSPQGRPQLLDLYLPDAQLHPGPRPTAVFIHGGGWTGGSRGDARARPEIDELVARGYAVAALDYRLAPAAPFPAALDDVRCAVRFLRAQASRWSLDPQRLVAWGSSAGGHLAALLAYTRPEDGLGTPVSEWAGVSHQVRAVALLWAPLDLPALLAGAASSTWTPIFGSDAAALARYSPNRYARAASPPTLLVHGTRDVLVSPAQSLALLQSLQQLNVPAGLQLVSNAGHSLDLSGGSALYPGRGDVARQVARFFDIETQAPGSAVRAQALGDLECVAEWLPTARGADFNGAHAGLHNRSTAAGPVTLRNWAGSQTWWATDGQQTWVGGGRFGSAGLTDGPLAAAVAQSRAAECGLPAHQ